MHPLLSHYLLSRFIGDAFIDVSESGWFASLLAAEVARGTQAREFNFNTVDVVVSWADDTVTIYDALEVGPGLEVGLDQISELVSKLDSFEPRIRARVETDFRQDREEAYATLGQIHSSDLERLPAAALIFAEADLTRLKRAVEQSHIDWRDLLLWTGLEQSSWREDLDQIWSTLGSNDS